MRLDFLNNPALRSILRRLGTSLVTLVIIAYLTLFGLILAERGQERLPADPVGAAGAALVRTVTYLTNHPTTYYWHKETVAVIELIAVLFGRSAGLLLIALGIAVAVGVPLGMVAALTQRRRQTLLVLLLSILGVSTPSFLLAMLLWMIDIQLYQRLAIPPLPPTGFGWDGHAVMPALVLAARPLAQIAQVTYVSLSNVLGQDYIQTAQSKGLRQRVVIGRHALRNILVPILTTLGTSLRFSLASLPVVEFFFIWPGVGLTLLQAIEAGMASLVTDLVVTLGLLFLLINLLLELIYLVLDPRLRQGILAEEREERPAWRERLADLRDALTEWAANLRRRVPGLGRRRPALPPLPARINNDVVAPATVAPASSAPRRLLPSIMGNPALLIGLLLVLALFFLAVQGDRLTQANPYETHGVMMVNGEVGGPPFRPSSVFPWGTDPVGRDVQALVLAGAKRTLALAVFAMLARMAVGSVLGALAGWWRGGWLDRLIIGAVGVWAAFPATLFAMILILALGIQQGMGVFVLALCVVGWGEIAQFVRGQVVGIKPQPYIEAAQAVGARTDRLLSRHVLPNLLPSLLVLAVLEMGGVLMLLAELGFLNIFMGGGFRVQIGETGAMVPVVYYFSDVPEWGALLANIRNWWRSYPWMGWYPGLFFFMAILTFNLWGQGLRRFLDESRLNISRLFNRYTVMAAGALALGFAWVLQTTSPLGQYRPQVNLFDEQWALQDVKLLTSPQFQGRETGTPGAKLAAEAIAGRMQEVGLLPAGQDDTYIQTIPAPRFHLTEVPRLEVLDSQGKVAEALVYRRDFVEYVGSFPTNGEGTGGVVGLALGPDPGTSGRDPYGLGNLDLRDKVILVSEAGPGSVNTNAVAGVLVVTDDPLKLQRKYLFSRGSADPRFKSSPVLAITSQAAERLLATAGSSLAQLSSLAAGLQPGQISLTRPGATVHLAVVGTYHDEDPNEKYYNVIGYIPGTGSGMEVGQGRGLDSHVIIVGAYYDGLGTGPNGTLYAGANDNASGVATMLELARALKQSPYQPKKTVVFVAWSGGERGESLSVFDIMNARVGFNSLTVEAVIELSGVGAGAGQGIALGEGSSYRLTQLFRGAASRLGVATTARGQGPHFGLLARPGFGGRSALSAYVSWDGSDRTAHTVGDVLETIDPQKLKQVGQTTLLALTVLSREVDY